MATSLATATSPAQIHPVAPAKVRRISAIDFTKGALVLFMVLYHWLNYFFGPQGDSYKYLRFLTPSFIFITGFVISHVHLSRPIGTISHLPWNLARRGLKILALFIILNALIVLIIPHAAVKQMLSSPASLVKILSLYALGDVLIPGVGKIASFYILVPIGYLLLISGAMVTVSRTIKHILPITCALLLLCVSALGFLGVQNGTLELVVIGLMGEVAGRISRDRLDAVSHHPYSLLVAYGAYLAAITIWGVPFPLRIAGVFLTLMLLYLCGSARSAPGPVQRMVITLGEYSLFGYIVQIGLLQVIHRIAIHFESGVAVLVVTLATGTILTVGSVEVLSHLRPQQQLVDRMYRLVFA